MIIRPLRAEDRESWEPLWHGYLAFYRAALTPDVTEQTWAALIDRSSAVHGLVAEQDDQLVGLAHLILHPTTWATRPTCYLEDTLRRPSRGAAEHRPPTASRPSTRSPTSPRAATVYWLTQEYNAPARSLYDTLARRTSFVVYER